jgi:hypothetical protein
MQPTLLTTEAILLTEENIPEITQKIEPEADPRFLEMYLRNPKRWYVVKDFFGASGDFFTWTIFPAYFLEKKYYFDSSAAHSTWTEINRK